MANKILGIVAVSEAIVGLILLIYPPIVIQLLFGAELIGIGIVITRITGICLISLGVACFPNRESAKNFSSLIAMLLYGLIVTLYLGFLGIIGKWIGLLLWPVVALHALVSLLLLWEIRR